MKSMIIYYGGEDEVTRQVAKRLVSNWAEKQGDIEIEIIDIDLRARGRKVLEKLDNIIELGKKVPVVFVIDSDADCPVTILKQNCKIDWKSTYSSINIAIDEAEAWLLADKKGIAAFLGIKQADIPKHAIDDGVIKLDYKTSLYIMRELVPKSRKQIIKDNMTMKERARKPSTYNNLWPNYIARDWDIEEATNNSNSLSRAVRRINERLDEFLKETLSN